MALKDAKVPWIIGMVIYVFAFLLYYIGFSTPYWFWVTSSPNVDGYYGLFQACAESDGYVECEYLAEVGMADWHIAGLVLACLGLPLFLVGMVLPFCGISQNVSHLQFTGAGIGAFAGLIGIAAGIVILVNAKEDFTPFSVGGSAIVFLIGCSFAILSGALQVIGIVRSTRSS